MSDQQDNMQLDTPVAEHPEDKLVLNSPDQARTPKDFVLWAGVLVLAILTVYSPAFHGKFIWDDARYVEHNLALRSTEGLEQIWTSLRTEPQYYPLTHTSYWLEYQLSAKDANGQADPLVFHITNTALHAIAAILLWLVLRRLGLPAAWLIAAIWAVHPLQTESVAWISERKNVLSGVFFFGSILAYLMAYGIGGSGEGKEQEEAFPWGGWTVALVLFVCALLSKTVACSMPAVVLLLVWWKRGRVPMRQVLALLPFFVIGAGFALMTAGLEVSQVRAVGNDWALTPAGHVLVAGRAIWFYAAKNIWPYPLSFSYFKWHVDASQPWQWVFPAGVVLVIAGLFALRRRIGRGPVVAALIFCGVLVPALGFFNIYPMRYSYVADHFQYLAGPALIAVVVVAVVKLVRLMLAGSGKLHDRPAPYVLSAIVLVVLGGMSFVRAQVFTGMIPLWRDVVVKNPDSWMGHYNLGTALMKDADEPGHTLEERTKMLDEAAAQFALTVQIRPQHDNAYNNWGKVLYEQGHPDAALAKFHKAIEIDPTNIAVVQNIAAVVAGKGDYAQAESLLRHALDLRRRTLLPRNPRSICNSDRCLRKRGG